MKKRNSSRGFIFLLSLTSLMVLSSWGVWGHQRINKAAVFALPEEMRSFFYNHIDFITEEAIVPDLRKYTLNDKAENPRHFIDIEEFGKSIDSIPRKMKEASAAYEEKFLQKNGILPWYIQDVMEKLTKAFKEKKKTEILFLAGDLGHYLADACMPLHTSTNHDGQLTNQKGIHAFWESQLPELFGDKFNFNTDNAKYIDDVTKETWRIITSSHQLVDTLLAVDKNLKATFPEDKIFKKDESGNLLKNKYNQPVHTMEYATKFHEQLKGMVERQMRTAITAASNYWYTAWVNAGKPDLNTLDDPELAAQNKKSLEKDFDSWKKGKLTKVKTENEF